MSKTKLSIAQNEAKALMYAKRLDPSILKKMEKAIENSKSQIHHVNIIELEQDLQENSEEKNIGLRMQLLLKKANLIEAQRRLED